MDNSQMQIPQGANGAAYGYDMSGQGMPTGAGGMGAGGPMGPGMPMQPGIPMQPGMPMQAANGGAINVPEKKVDLGPIIKTIAIIVLALLSITFIGLFIWKNSQYIEAQTDVDEKIAVAVADAKDEQAEKDEKEFAEREKYPFRNFAGPADYGQLSFEYPKTWSLYIPDDAMRGGDYRAFFNPIEVESIESREAVFSLRLEILDRAFDDVVSEYQGAIEEGTMSLDVINVSSATANRYTGQIPGTEFSGTIVVFKIRDKTVVLRTDSVLFTSDFERLLSTVTFNA